MLSLLDAEIDRLTNQTEKNQLSLSSLKLVIGLIVHDMVHPSTEI